MNIMICKTEGCFAKLRKSNSNEHCRLHSVCIESDCNAIPYAKGLCYNCYQKRYRGPTKRDSKQRCAAKGCKHDPWRGRRKLADGKDWEVRFDFDGKQYCSIHRPQGVMPKELFPKEYQE